MGSRVTGRHAGAPTMAGAGVLQEGLAGKLRQRGRGRACERARACAHACIAHPPPLWGQQLLNDHEVHRVVVNAEDEEVARGSPACLLHAAAATAAATAAAAAARQQPESHNGSPQGAMVGGQWRGTGPSLKGECSRLNRWMMSFFFFLCAERHWGLSFVLLCLFQTYACSAIRDGSAHC